MIIQYSENYTTIIADDGMMLYRDDIIIPAAILGCNDFPENWQEITIEEAEALEEQWNSEIPEELRIDEASF